MMLQEPHGGGYVRTKMRIVIEDSDAAEALPNSEYIAIAAKDRRSIFPRIGSQSLESEVNMSLIQMLLEKYIILYKSQGVEDNQTVHKKIY
jgi:hypothetical protein